MPKHRLLYAIKIPIKQSVMLQICKLNINFAIMNTSFDSSNSPLVSFIITCRNLPVKQITECLDSITGLSLRTQEKEIIVIDDGSDVSIIDRLEKYRDEIIYVRQKKNGVSSARNLGLRMASGNFIQFINGEDKLIPDAYEHCLDIVRYNVPDIVLFNSSGKKKGTSSFYIPEPMDGAHYMRHNNLHATAWGYIFNRKILLDLRFNPSLLNTDEEFTPQLFLRAEKVYSTDIVAYSYKKRPSDSIKDKDPRLILKRLNDIEHIIFHLKELSEQLPIADSQALQRRVSQLTIDYIFSIIRLTRSSKQLSSRLKRLEDCGLFPLPDKRYSRSYTILRKLTKNRMLRKCLSLVLK